MKNKFSEKTKHKLITDNAGYCSECGNYLYNETSRTFFSEIAHIHAANPGGPRFDPNINPSKAENGLAVCPTCHTQIDSNVSYYTVEYLKGIKLKAKLRGDEIKARIQSQNK